MVKRDYRKEWNEYKGRPGHRESHSHRVRARQIAEQWGMVRKGDGLHVHHISVDTLDNSPDNLIALDPCTHRLLHGDPCSGESKARPVVIKADARSWLARCPSSRPLLTHVSGTSSLPMVCLGRLSQGKRLFLVRLRHVLSTCRRVDWCPDLEGPSYEAYLKLGREARARIRRKRALTSRKRRRRTLRS